MEENVSKQQVKTLLFVYLIGHLLLVGVQNPAGRDAWIAALCALVVALVLYKLYVRPMQALKCSDIFCVYYELFGKFAGRILTIASGLCAIYFVALSLREFALFLSIVSPFSQTLAMAMLIVVGAYGARTGLDGLGRFSELIWIIMGTVLAFLLLLNWKNFNGTHLQPILAEGPKPLAKGTFMLLSTLYLEGYFLLSMVGKAAQHKNFYKNVVASVLAAGVLLSLTLACNMMTLGVDLARQSEYPTYLSASMIGIGQFFRRPEIIIASLYLLGVLLKINILLSFIARSFCTVSSHANVKKAIIGVAAVAFAIAISVFSVELNDVVMISLFVGVPFVVWILAEIKKKKSHK